MPRVLLADDSLHAQRMGERILRGEGYEVVTVTDGQTALVRLADVDPDVVLADVSLPGRSGYDICRELKARPRHRHVRVILTAGLLEHVDESEAISVRCDAVLRKPFESSALLSAVRPLVEAAVDAKPESGDRAAAGQQEPPDANPDPERIRAAVTVALDAALPSLIDNITEKVLIALRR